MAGPEPEPVSSAAATTPAPSAPVVLPKTSESDQLLKIRHSMSHVMAMAVQQLFPKARVTIGPWTETGFYYDFDLSLIHISEPRDLSTSRMPSSA